ncbi:hypothetical protein BOX15_Mlig006013g3, partial [Macrostomum lignano]
AAADLRLSPPPIFEARNCRRSGRSRRSCLGGRRSRCRRFIRRRHRGGCRRQQPAVVSDLDDNDGVADIDSSRERQQDRLHDLAPTVLRLPTADSAAERRRRRRRPSPSLRPPQFSRRRRQSARRLANRRQRHPAGPGEPLPAAALPAVHLGSNLRCRLQQQVSVAPAGLAALVRAGPACRPLLPGAAPAAAPLRCSGWRRLLPPCRRRDLRRDPAAGAGPRPAALPAGPARPNCKGPVHTGSGCAGHHCARVRHLYARVSSTNSSAARHFVKWRQPQRPLPAVLRMLPAAGSSGRDLPPRSGTGRSDCVTNSSLFLADEAFLELNCR